MRKLYALLTMVAFGLQLVPVSALAAVTVTANSLVTSPITAKASSTPIGLFSFTAGQTAGETLSSVTITLANSGSSVATGSHFASLNVYKDTGNGTFEPGTDLLAGSQTTVTVGSTTTISTTTNNAIDGGKFFIALATSGTWTATSPADSITAALATNGIATSTNSPTMSAVSTSTITADTAGPALSSVVANNTGGTGNKEAGDSLVLTFNEATNKPAISSANVAATLALNNSHSWLDGAAVLGATSWNAAGTALTITLTAGTSLPTVAVGDTVTVQGIVIQDTLGNAATGSKVISGTFGTTANPPATPCNNGLTNGQFYFQIGKGNLFYKADNCVLVASSLKDVRKVHGRKAHGLKKVKNFLKNDRWEQNNGHDNGKHNGKDRD